MKPRVREREVVPAVDLRVEFAVHLGEAGVLAGVARVHVSTIAAITASSVVARAAVSVAHEVVDLHARGREHGQRSQQQRTCDHLTSIARC